MLGRIWSLCKSMKICANTDYRLFGLVRQIGQINSGAFVLFYFRPNYQHPFWCIESLVHYFRYSIIISKKHPKPLYPHPKYLFGILILIWASKRFSLHVFVVRVQEDTLVCVSEALINYILFNILYSLTIINY